MLRKKRFIPMLTTLVFMLFFVPKENLIFAASESKNQDSYFALEFQKFGSVFDEHVRQLQKCISEMEAFENQSTELAFNGAECARLEAMRPEAQRLYGDARALLEKYIQWIGTLTESTFKDLVKLSNSAQSTLLTSMRSYLDKHQEALRQSERLMQKQSQRLKEMEQRVEEAQRQIESRQGG